MKIDIPEVGRVSALLTAPSDARAAYVFAHGAGAGVDHPFMADLAQALAQRQVATLRFQFPFMERGSKRADPPAIAQAAVRAAVAAAAQALSGLPLFAGGKSFGGRMSSQAQAASPLPGVKGLAFVGFPLHPAGKPGVSRAQHLSQVNVPMLFLQGTRDALAGLPLLQGVLAPLGERATLVVIDDADHAFHVRVRSGTNDAAVRVHLAETLARWTQQR
jgi:uncharacterized protein